MVAFVAPLIITAFSPVLLCEKVEETEGVGATRRGGPMGTIVSRPTGKEYGVGGFRGGVDCIEAIVSGLWCRGSSCGGPLCRGYGVGGRCVSICWVEDMVSGEAMVSRAVVWRSTVSRLAGAIVR